LGIADDVIALEAVDRLPAGPADRIGPCCSPDVVPLDNEIEAVGRVHVVPLVGHPDAARGLGPGLQAEGHRVLGAAIVVRLHAEGACAPVGIAGGDQGPVAPAPGPFNVSVGASQPEVTRAAPVGGGRRGVQSRRHLGHGDQGLVFGGAGDVGEVSALAFGPCPCGDPGHGRLDDLIGVAGGVKCSHLKDSLTRQSPSTALPKVKGLRSDRDKRL